MDVTNTTNGQKRNRENCKSWEIGRTVQFCNFVPGWGGDLYHGAAAYFVCGSAVVQIQTSRCPGVGGLYRFAERLSEVKNGEYKTTPREGGIIPRRLSEYKEE